MKKLAGLGSIKRGKQGSTMSQLSGLADVRAGKGKAVGTLMPKKGFQMSKLKGLGEVRKGKGAWGEYVESFNRPSGAERQEPHYRNNGKG